jgi:flagellin
MAVAANAITTGSFVQEKVTIDNVEITIDWQNLSSADQATIKTGTASGADADAMKAAAELITNTINDAIDQSGHNIEHVKGYVDSANKFVLESGSKGTNSKITTTANQVLGTLIGSATTGSGTSVYNGTAVTAASKVDFKIGDITMQASLGAIANGAAMTTAAKAIETAINTAISTYNNDVLGSDTHENAIKDVKVNVTDDGRFEIISESGPISLSDLAGSSVVNDLGLSQAQTDASGNGGMTLQIGANRGQTMTFGVGDMRSAALGVTSVNVGTQAGASKALDTIDKAIRTVSEQRSALGAAQNRLEHTIKNLDTSAENLQASEARIRDVDMAKEMMEQNKTKHPTTSFNSYVGPS